MVEHSLSSKPSYLSQVIKEQAHSLGFDLIGITTPDPPQHLAVFEGWLAAGRHGEMDYLAAETSLLRRADPRNILPDCRSILVLGFRYAGSVNTLPPESPIGNSITGRVASYAWGSDYHEVLSKRLAELIDFIERQVGRRVPNRPYTDTGPLLERELGQRAGLGWIGKNSCLIHPRHGSWFLLAEILLGLELEPDPPFAFDRCGSCTRCLDACPTSCILPDRTIDARRCISYLTIELKGEIPEDLRSRLGNWVFGCDICQQVCPWNRRFKEGQIDRELQPRPGFAHPDLHQELALTPEGFNRKFKGSSQKRAKRRGYLRNVALALGNIGNEAAVGPLGKALADLEPLVRIHVAWALGRIGGAEAAAILRRASQTEGDARVASQILAALHGINKRGKA